MSIETRVTASGDALPAAQPITLPAKFIEWFGSKGWAPRAHQLELLSRAQAGRSSLLIAPTGAGKTLAGFLPALTDLADREPLKPGEPYRGVHTLYISPLKALAVDILRNLETPIAEMGLKVRSETRTGDTPTHKRTRQKQTPPDILLTTPEQISLLIASKDAERFFKDLKYVIFDELHALVTSKRGHLLALGLARLRALSPDLQTVGLSATVSEPDELRRWLVAQNTENSLYDGHMSDLVVVEGGAKPDISILETEHRLPWAGHSARYAIPEIYEQIKAHRTTLLFVNTRSQSELLFRELWHINEDNLPIALHHGSLEPSQRRKVEAAMGRNELRAVIATSTLDLGIDWGDVDLVVHFGAPKGASRLAQRIGRANHRMDEPSKAILVPANRFEVMECQAALDANYLGDQDTPALREGSLDVLCQHVLGRAVGSPFDEDEFYAEVISAAPYAKLDWDTFEQAIQFVATGGYALKVYERYAKIKKTEDGTWRLTHPRFAAAYRMNAGTIYEPPALAIRVTKGKLLPSGQPKSRGGGGRVVGKLDEFFINQLTAGDTFMFAGQTLEFMGVRDQEAVCRPSRAEEPRVPMYAGSKFPLSTSLADHIRRMMANPNEWARLPEQVREWLTIQARVSVMPKADELLVETFPRGKKHFMIVYSFEGRLAHQTLGMLLSKRLDRYGARPIGFVATDYAINIYMSENLDELIDDGLVSMGELFDEDMMGEDLDDWMMDSFMLKRTFRYCAIVAGLIERHSTQASKSGKQMTVSSDLIYDVLREHEPDHIVMQATYADAAAGLLDVRRVGDLLGRIKGHIRHVPLERISPMAVPIMLEAGRERVESSGDNALLAEAAENMIEEAMSI